VTKKRLLILAAALGLAVLAACIPGCAADRVDLVDTGRLALENNTLIPSLPRSAVPICRDGNPYPHTKAARYSLKSTSNHPQQGA